MATCACGACSRCRRRLAQEKYRRSDKGRAALARYNHGPKRLATNTRYYQSAHGQLVIAANNAKRIYVGNDYRGHAKTIEQATVIRSHIKERLSVFIKGQQGREEAQGSALGAASTEAAS